MAERVVKLSIGVDNVGYDDVADLLANRDLGKRRDWFYWRARQQRSGHRSQLDDLGLSGLVDAERRKLRSWFAAGCPRWPQSRYTAYFFELDAWSEYWDIYHPETRGCFHFGDGSTEGHLSKFLPTPAQPQAPVFEAWKKYALASREPARVLEARQSFERQIATRPDVADAIIAVDRLVRKLIDQHFRVDGVLDVDAYLDAMERFARDTLPECPDRYQRIAEDDPRKPYSGRHMMAGDIMWFAWAVHLAAVQVVASPTPDELRVRSLLMAGVAFGCAMDYAFSGRCRTRKQFEVANSRAWRAIWNSGRDLARDFDRAAREVRDLFFIRTYGDA